MSPGVLITFTACLLIFLAFVTFMLRWDARAITQGPSILTMLGIGGTFFGIAMALLSFDAANVQGSIPELIDGLKTAVWASFVGVLAAIFLKLRFALEREANEIDDPGDGERISAQLAALQNALVGGDEATVISQMKLARSDVNDRLDSIRKSQVEFMERLAEMSSKTLVEALRDVIKDFNAKINEQFGDNFKQLNEAVGKILVWQQEYRSQLDLLIDSEKQSAETMGVAVKHYQTTLEAAGSLIEVADDFRSILGGIEEYKTNLRNNTEQLAALITSISAATPLLQSQIEDLIRGVGDSVVRNEAEVERISAEISRRFEAAADAVQNGLTVSLAEANKEVNENISRLLGSTRELTEQLQIGLEESLNESLLTLGQQLASLSNRFADDYGPIADRLREVVKAST